jgi:hypothetical protein
MKCIYGIFFLIALVLASGCASTSLENSAPATPAPTATMAVPAASEAGPALAELSDARPNTSLPLEAGAIVFSFRADGAQKMAVSLTEGNGTSYGEMAELVMTGPFAGSLVFGPPDTAEYRFSVTGSGAWTGQLSRPDCTNPLSAPVNLSGDGAEVAPCFTLEKGSYIFNREETGFSSPVFELRYANGSMVMNATNTCVLPCLGPGSPHPFAIMEIPEDGSYFLGVIPRDNPHPWNVSISAVPAIPEMGPGPVILPDT